MIREDVVREMLARLERGEGIKRTAPELGVDYEIYQRLHPVIGEHDHGVVLDVLRAALACSVCGGNVSMVCPGCAGRIGGKRVTTRK